MKITIEPTPEMHDFAANGVTLPARVWIGTTENGQTVDLYILSVVPTGSTDKEMFLQQLPDYMKPTREMYDLPEEEKAKKPDEMVQWFRELHDGRSV